MPRQTAATSVPKAQARRDAVSRAIAAVSQALSILPVDLRNVLQTIVDQARIVAGARYAALGIIAAADRPFEPWVYSGVSPEQAAAIGRHPRPVGLLGAVPGEDETIRVRDAQQDPRFRGYPAHHPRMHSFLGVPIRWRGRSVGNLYLADKEGAEEFSEEDEWAVELLATHAGLALQVARLDDLRTAVEAERARLQTILESAPYAILYVESESGQVLVNPAAVELLGRQPGASDGLAQFEGKVLRPSGEPVPLGDLPVSNALRGQVRRAEEYAIQRPDGSRLPVLVGAAPVRQPDGRIIGAVTVFEDISSMKELERLREEWASIIAHDLRQPVAVIAGYISILERLLAQQATADGEVTAKAVRHISAAARNLDKMVGDLLDISRLEARRLTLEKQKVDLPALVQAVAERAASVTPGHAVKVGVAGEIPILWADPRRIEQVLGNLLSNASKYGYSDTEIQVQVERRDGEVQVLVSNDGPGIPADELPHLFTRFYRARQSREERAPGLGLGLYISRGLVEAHGGRIWAESTRGKVTTFGFGLPVGVPPPDRSSA